MIFSVSMVAVSMVSVVSGLILLLNLIKAVIYVGLTVMVQDIILVGGLDIMIFGAKMF